MTNQNDQDNPTKIIETLDGPKPENNLMHKLNLDLIKEQEKHLEKTNAPKLVFKLDHANEHENDHQYFTTNVPLQQIERDFNNFLQELAADRGISLAKLKGEGYNAQYNPQGNVLTLSFPNAQHSQQFFNRLQAQNKINGPFTADQAAQNRNSALPTPKPGGRVDDENEKSTTNQGHRSPSPFRGMPGETPSLERR